jgi:hypothetical protein
MLSDAAQTAGIIIVMVIRRRIRTDTIPVPFLLYRFHKVISSLLIEIKQTTGL